MKTRIRLIADAAIIVAATLFSVVLVKNYLLQKPQLVDAAEFAKAAAASKRSASENQIPPGAKISLPGVDWAKNGQTLLLAVSDKCHFCSESGPFYQRLAEQHRKGRLVAVLPQPVDQGKTYLDKLNVAVDDIRQAPLTTMGVRGTPSLVLVDKAGTVVKSWVGKLPANKEEEVLASLR
jgi:hypothetical protein